VILKNIRDDGFAGDVQVINPRYGEIDGLRTVARLEDLVSPPDLAVVTAPPGAIPEIIRSAAT